MSVHPEAVRTRHRRPSTWGWLVAVSAFVVASAAIAMGLWWVLTLEQRIASYDVRGGINGVVLDMDSADAEIVGAGDESPVSVRRTERFAFGRRPQVERDTAGGVLSITVRCPKLLVGGCASRYRVAVPANVPVTVRSSSGDVRFRGYRGSARIDTGDGDIAVSSYCGFVLRAHTTGGDVRAIASCPTERLDLRSQEGDIRATVPPGRYRVDAESDNGFERIDGLVTADDAPYTIQALTGTGDVVVESD